jgi:hypothetical protein
MTVKKSSESGISSGMHMLKRKASSESGISSGMHMLKRKD